MIANPSINLRRFAPLALLAAVSICMLVQSSANGYSPQGQILVIGTTDPGTGDAKQDAGDVKQLTDFIKNETGFTAEIKRFPNAPAEVADQLSKGKIQLAAFQGYEFAWVLQANPKLKPLTIAVNGKAFSQALLVTNKGDAAKNVGALKGQKFALPKGTNSFLKAFVVKQINGASIDSFFKVVAADNVEEALNQVVDGEAKATVVDKISFERFEKRGAARAAKLTTSLVPPETIIPALIAYNPGDLKESTLTTFRTGMLNANKKAAGRENLTLFHLTGFEPVPDRLDAELQRSLKDYPPPKK